MYAGTGTCPYIVLRLTAIEDLSMLWKQGSMAIVMGGAVQFCSRPHCRAALQQLRSRSVRPL